MWYLVKTMNDKYSIRYHHTEDDNPYCSLRDNYDEVWVSSISAFTRSKLTSGISCSIQYIQDHFRGIELKTLPLITDPDASIEVFHSTYPELFL